MKRSTRQGLAVGVVVATLVAAVFVAYALSRSDRYEAEAAVEVTPVAADDETFAGFSILREGQDPVETAAQLVETRPVADAVALRLRLGGGEEALDRVDARAEPRGRVVRVRARADRAIEAARIANAFADELVRQRSSLFQSELQRTIESLRRQPQTAEVTARLGRLRSYEGQGDPTLRVASAATAPREAASSNVPILAIGLPLALLLGAAAAVAVARPRLPRPTRREPEPTAVSEPAPGAFSVDGLGEVLREHADALPAERQEELRSYLEYLRPYADDDGTLPKSFDPLVDEVFGDLLRR